MAEEKSPWSEYKNSEGRVYWSHAITKQSVWEKPDELRTPFERAIQKTQWKQYTSKDRPYYVHSVTKETKWELPAELVKLREKVEAMEAWKKERERRRAEGLSSPTPPPRSRSPTPDNLQANDFNALARLEPKSIYPPRPAPERSALVWPVGGFLTHEKAEEAFIRLLKFEGIDETWTWEETMRKIIIHPFYKALDTMAEKKAAFEKYTRGIVEGRRTAKEARMARIKPLLLKLFAATPEIRGFSTIKTADIVFLREREWREAHPDERQEILEQYTADLRHQEQAKERDLRLRNIDALNELIKTLDITVSTRWRAAHDIIVSSEAFRDNRDLQQIDTIDILSVYDEYARQLEKEHEEESRKLRIEQVRRGRKAREAFKGVLHDLTAKGELTRLSKWKDTFPKIRDDQRFKDLLGLQGSSPMDLWMDAVDDLGEEVERAAEKIGKAFSDLGKEVVLETKEEEYEEWIKEAHLDTQIEAKLRKEVYELIHGKLEQAKTDETRRLERKRRHRIDDLRYALRKVEAIKLDMSFEQAEEHMKALPEYAEVESEEDRKAAFEKFVTRQKEKEQEKEKEREKEDSGSSRARRASKGGEERERENGDEEGRSRRKEEWERTERSERGDRDRRDRDRSDRDRERDHRSSRTDADRERERDRRDRDKYRERDRDRDGHRDRDRSDREKEKYRDRSRSRERRHRDEDRHHDSPRDRTRDREREERRERKRYSLSAEPDDRDLKRPRKSSISANGHGHDRMDVDKERKDDETEEGEI